MRHVQLPTALCDMDACFSKLIPGHQCTDIGAGRDLERRGVIKLSIALRHV